MEKYLSKWLWCLRKLYLTENQCELHCPVSKQPLKWGFCPQALTLWWISPHLSLTFRSHHTCRSLKIHLQPQKNHVQMYIYFHLRGTCRADGRNFTESENHWMVWVRKGFKRSFHSNLLPWAGNSPTGAGCSKANPTLEMVGFSPLATERQGWRAPGWSLQYPSLSSSETKPAGNTPEKNNPKMENSSRSRDCGKFSAIQPKLPALLLNAECIISRENSDSWDLSGATKKFFTSFIHYEVTEIKTSP